MEYRGLKLDRFQTEAIDHLQSGRSVLVAAPTGTGKTIIADWIVEEALTTGKHVIYTAPIKALSNQKFRDYCRLYGDSKVGLVTGDLVIRRDAPCLIMTTEILRNMLLLGENMDRLLAVVIDEVHFLDDRERGTVWEEVLIYLPSHVRVVALSATLPNLDAFSEWMTSVRGHEVAVVTETTRAVPLDFFVADTERGLVPIDDFDAIAKQQAAAPAHDHRARGRKHRGRERNEPPHRGQSQDRGPTPWDIFKIVDRKRWLPMLHFVFSRKDAERFARQLARRKGVELLNDAERAEVERRLDALAEVASSATLDDVAPMYLRGVAFHHAGLHVHLKAFVEELYEAKLIKVLYCTSTFALGINMPARTVAFHSIIKFDGQEMRPLPTRGFMQKAGRAGRRGLDSTGHVVLGLSAASYMEHRGRLRGYMEHRYEPVRSSFSLSWNSVVHLLRQHSEDHIRTIVEKSFLSFHLTNQARENLARAEQIEAKAGGDRGSKGAMKEARRLRRRADGAEDRCWNEFLRKRDFLIDIGYLGSDASFQSGGRILQHLQISEVLTTELVLSGVLEPLPPAVLFGVLCAITNTLPRAANIGRSPDRKERELLQRIEQVRRSAPVTRAEAISGQQAEFDGQMYPLGFAWASGQSLDDVLSLVRSPTDLSGSLVSAFRRAKELTSQLKDVYAEDPHRSAELKGLIKSVSRDEVEVVD